MRVLTLFLSLVVGVGGIAAEEYLAIRPALLGQGPKSLIVNIVREYPPGAGFGKFVLRRIDAADLSPPFLNGHAVTASTVWMIPFDATGLKYWVN